MKSQPDLTTVFTQADNILIQKRWTFLLFTIILLSFFFPFCSLQSVQKSTAGTDSGNKAIYLTGINFLTDDNPVNINAHISGEEEKNISRELTNQLSVRFLILTLFLTAIIGLLVSRISKRGSPVLSLLMAETGLLSLLILRWLLKRDPVIINSQPHIQLHISFQIAYWTALTACFLAISITYVQWKFYKTIDKSKSAKANNHAIRVNIITQNFLPEN